MNLEKNADINIFLKKRKGCFFLELALLYRKAGKWYYENHFRYVSHDTIVITALLVSLTAFLCFTELQYSLNTFCSPPETSNFLIRLPLPFHNITYRGKPRVLFSYLIFLEDVCAARYIFPCHLPSKETVCVSRIRFARALRHLLVHIYTIEFQYTFRQIRASFFSAGWR